MLMYNGKRLFGIFLYVLIVTCFLLSVLYEFQGDDILSYSINCLIAPLITISYLCFIKQKNTFFLLFLLLHSTAGFFGIILVNLSSKSTVFLDIEYYIGNSLYILAYVFLILKIVKSLDFSFIVKSFKTHVAVLAILNIYLLYVLQSLIYPNLVYKNDFYLECAYNIVILLVLSLSLLNYFHKDNKKALYLFTGSLLLVFSEVMDVAFIYAVDRLFIKILSLKFSFVGFYFIYEQSKLLNVSKAELDNEVVC